MPENLNDNDIEDIPPAEATPENTKQPASIKKLLSIGIPVLVLQLAIAYFVVGKFVVASNPAVQDNPEMAGKVKEKAGQSKGDTQPEPAIFVVKDIVINPSGTNGLRYLLTTIALEVDSKEAVVDLQKREVQISDALIRILSSKTLEEIGDPGYRETLRKEIAKEVGALLKVGKLLNVYFSKFVIQ